MVEVWCVGYVVMGPACQMGRSVLSGKGANHPFSVNNSPSLPGAIQFWGASLRGDLL